MKITLELLVLAAIIAVVTFRGPKWWRKGWNRKRRTYDTTFADTRSNGTTVLNLERARESGRLDELVKELAEFRLDPMPEANPLADKGELLDSVNLALLGLIQKQNRRLSYDELVSLRGVASERELKDTSPSERYYRMAFLVHVRLVSEGPDDGSIVYTLTSRGIELLAASLSH